MVRILKRIRRKEQSHAPIVPLMRPFRAPVCAPERAWFDRKRPFCAAMVDALGAISLACVRCQ
jgi:hypothetical protein